MQGQIRGVCSPTLLQPASGLRLKTTVQLSAKTGRVALQCKAVAYDEPALAVKKANDTQVANSSDHSDADKLSKEEERRKKISAANKGKTPWNKGLHYTDEVRARISRATFLAMQRPEVRAKMNEANQHRPPHREEVKLKIKQSLKEHASRCKAIIDEQVELIITKMENSGDVQLKRCAQYKDSRDLIRRAAWSMWKREQDLHYIAENWDEVEEFRTLAVKKINDGLSRQSRMEEQRRNVARRQASRGKVQSALRTAKKLAHAKTKLAEAEVAVANLQRLKQQLAADPVKYAAAVAAEEQASMLMQNLRAQVTRLTEALAPLSQFLTLDAQSEVEVELAVSNGSHA